MVDAASYSAARARKPGWRGGLVHVTEPQAGVGEGVHVPGQRTVDERDEHALLHLLDRLVLHQVGADPPVLLGRVEHLVVDPAAVRASGAAGGSGRRGSGRRAPAPAPPRRWPRRRRGCARTRGTRRRRRRHRRGTAGAPRRRGAYVGPPPRRTASATCAAVGSTPTTVVAPLAVASRAIWPSPHPRSRTAGRAGQVLGGQREDLLLVLRVGTLGEPVLPPAGVRLPEGGFVHVRPPPYVRRFRGGPRPSLPTAPGRRRRGSRPRGRRCAAAPHP